MGCYPSTCGAEAASGTHWRSPACLEQALRIHMPVLRDWVTVGAHFFVSAFVWNRRCASSICQSFRDWATVGAHFLFQHLFGTAVAHHPYASLFETGRQLERIFCFSICLEQPL